METLSVTQLKLQLEELEKNGHGNMQVFSGFPTNLGFGVLSVRTLEVVELDSLFGKPMAFIKLR